MRLAYVLACLAALSSLSGCVSLSSSNPSPPPNTTVVVPQNN